MIKHFLPGALLILCLSAALQADTETYRYTLYYQGLPGGHAELKRTLTEERAELELYLKTNLITDRIFRIRDSIRVVADRRDFSLISYEKRIHEGRYHRIRRFHISEIPPDSLSAAIRDEYCAILMLMDPEFFHSRELLLNLFSKGREIPFTLREQHREFIPVDGHNTRSILYLPTEESLARVGKEDTRLSVWMRDELPSWPLQIRLEFKYGTVILKYRSRD